jgi:hypothetical protein
MMRKSYLRATAALQALALLGAGATTAFIAAAPAAAQDYTNVSATGRVIDANGAPIPGATVSVTSNAQGFTRQTTTDASGGYTIPQLPSGSYSFTISAPGKDSFTDPNVTLVLGNSGNEFQLGAAQVANEAGNTVVVTGRRVRTSDFDRNTTGAVIDVGELATRVPVARDITSVVLLSPGTAGGDTAFGNLPSINGASVSENVYYINGLNITDFQNGLGAVTVPFDFYQTVEVKNGGMPAEFGRTTGGFINAITKRGTNQYHASVTASWQPDFLRSDAPNTFAADNDASTFERREAILQVSGPIIKDRLFFYGLYNWRDVRQEFATTGTADALDPRINPATGAPRTRTPAQLAASCFINPTMCTTYGDLGDANLAIQGTGFFRDRSKDPFWGVKFDAIPIDGQRLEFTYFDTSGKTIRDTFGNGTFSLGSGLRYNPNTNEPGAYASSTAFRAGGKNYVARYTGNFTDWLTLSAAYGKNKNANTTESTTPNVPSIIDARSGSNVSIGNPTANANVAFQTRKFYRADADVIVNLFGRHHFRGGYDREDLHLSNFINANGGFQYTYAVAPGAPGSTDASTGLLAGTQYAVARTFVSGGEFNSRNTAYYLQDQWSLFGNRLQLNLGVRNDKFVSRNGDGVVFYDSGSNWAPRLGFSADPFGDQRTKVYGSFSRYYLPVAVNTNLRLAGGELDTDAYYLLTGLNPDNTPILGAPVTTGSGFRECPAANSTGAANCVVRNTGAIPGTTTTVASNLKAQSTDEYILGVERRLGSRIRVGVFGTYTKLNNSLEDAALDAAIIPLCVEAGNTPAECADVYPGVAQYALINPGEDVVIDLAAPFPNETEARQNVTLSAADLGYPHAKRTYKALTFTFDREWDGRWSLSANYTYSKLKGNIEGGIRSDNGQTDSGLTTAFDLPALVDGAYGYLPNDRRHNLKVYGSYRLFDWLTVGAQYSLTSPRHFGCLGRPPATADGSPAVPGGLAGQFYNAAGFYCNLDSDGNVIRNPITSAPGTFPVVNFPVVNDNPFNADGTPNTAVRPSTLQLTPRGSQFKSQWLSQLNLDFGFRLPVEFDANLRVSVFNVFNSQAKLDFVETGTNRAGQPNMTYSLPTTYQAPRSVRLSLGVGF